MRVMKRRSTRSSDSPRTMQSSGLEAGPLVSAETTRRLR